MLFTKDKGEIIDEEILIKRIHAAVRDVIEEDVQNTVDLHNFLCDGRVEVYKNRNGEPINKDGVFIEGADNSAWVYVFSKGDEDK